MSTDGACKEGIVLNVLHRSEYVCGGSNVSSKLNDLITDDATQANMRLNDCIKHHAGAFKLLKVTANYWPVLKV